MAFKNELLLLSGADIPFVEGTVTIHQPTIFEISLIGEDALFTGCELLKFSKDKLSTEDNLRLSNYTDFNILMSIIHDKSGSMQNNVSCAKAVLGILFPRYEIIYTQTEILFKLKGEDQAFVGRINDLNFLVFKEIINEIFCLNRASTQDYNVEGDLAKKIADKFRKRQQKLAEVSKKSEKVSVFSRYISILTVGTHKDMNSFMRYTVYQLFDEFQRFELKMGHDIFLQARLAGASGMKEPEDWMKDIHSGN